MGKKSRAKRNNPKSHASKSVAQQPAQEKREVKEVIPGSLSGNPVAKAEVKKHPINSKTANLDAWTEHIRTDMLRIILLLVVIGLVILILMVFNEKTSFLKTAGSDLGNFLNL